MRHIYKGQFAPMDKNVIWIKGDKMYLWGHNGWEEVTENTIVDDSMVQDSTHAVQSKVIQQYVNSTLGDINTILESINGE